VPYKLVLSSFLTPRLLPPKRLRIFFFRPLPTGGSQLNPPPFFHVVTGSLGRSGLVCEAHRPDLKPSNSLYPLLVVFAVPPHTPFSDYEGAFVWQEIRSLEVPASDLPPPTEILLVSISSFRGKSSRDMCLHAASKPYPGNSGFLVVEGVMSYLCTSPPSSH